MKGDVLVFSKLTANLSKFMMYVFNLEGLPFDALPQSPPSTTRQDANVEEKDLVMSHTSRLVPPLHQKNLLNN